VRPEHLTLALRPRAALEAVDLGFALARTHAREVWQAWLYFVLPVMLAILLLEQSLGRDSLLGGILLWLAKPYYDVVVLLVLSRAVFGARLSLRELAQELRRLAGTVFASLTLRRFSLSRSFLLPAHVLEGVRGARRRERVTVLATDTRGVARLTTMACGWCELVLLAGLAAMAVWLTPEVLRDDLFSAFGDDAGSPLVLLAWQLLYIAVVSVIEPFYVAAGFALYLNRRTLLEGWDIEVALRRVRARTTDRTDSAGGPR